MPKKAEEHAPYRYRRTFEAQRTVVSVAEMDKGDLQAYINKVLGVGEKKESPPQAEGI